MAVLQKIRDKNILLVSIIAIALLLFILSMSNKSCSDSSSMKAGEVAGDEISLEEYQKLVSNFQYLHDITNPNGQNTEEVQNQIHDQAWQSYVINKLVAGECEEVGLAVTDDEVNKVLTTDGKTGQQVSSFLAIFVNPQTMEYDANQFITLTNQLQEMKDNGQMSEDQDKLYNYIAFAKNQVKNELLLNKFNALLANGFITNPIEAKANFDLRTAGKDILLVSIPYTSVSDSTINVTADEITARFNSDKGKYMALTEVRDAKIIDVTVTPSAEDRTALENDFKGYYAELDSAKTEADINKAIRNSASDIPYSKTMKSINAFPSYIQSMLNGTDSIKLVEGKASAPRYDQIQNKYYTAKLISTQTLPDSVLQRRIVVTGANKKEISTRVDSIMTALGSAGGNFSAIAKTYGQQGDSAWVSTSDFERARMDSQDDVNFINQLFTAGSGIYKMNLQNDNVIIYQVLETRNPITKYDLAIIDKPLIFSDNTSKDTFNKISSFLASNKTIADIEANAEKSGYSVQSVSVVSNQHQIAQVSHTNDAIKWLFDEAEVGDVSQEVYRCGNNDHYMIVCLSGVSNGTYSETAVRDHIKEVLMNEKKAEVILKAIGDDVNKAKGYANAAVDTLTNVNAAMPAMVPSIQASEPKVSSIASKTAVGKTSKAFAGTRGVYMLSVLNNTKQEEKQVYEEKSEKDEVIRQNTGLAMRTLELSLMKKNKVTDTRYKFNM